MVPEPAHFKNNFHFLIFKEEEGEKEMIRFSRSAQFLLAREAVLDFGFGFWFLVFGLSQK